MRKIPSLAIATAAVALSGVAVAAPATAAPATAAPATAAPAAAALPDLVVSRPDTSPLNGFFGQVSVAVSNVGNAPATGVVLYTGSLPGGISVGKAIGSIEPGQTVRTPVGNVSGHSFIGFVNSSVYEDERDANQFNNFRLTFEVLTNAGLGG